MRTTLGDVAPALRRPAAVAALAAGVIASGLATLPFLVVWRLDLRVDALGTVGARTVAEVTGAEWSLLAWAALPAGLVLAAVALRLAVDLPLARTVTLALASAGVLAALGLAVLVLPPSAPAMPDRLPEEEIAMPVGVEMERVPRTTVPARAVLPATLLAAAMLVAAERRG